MGRLAQDVLPLLRLLPPPLVVPVAAVGVAAVGAEATVGGGVGGVGGGLRVGTTKERGGVPGAARPELDGADDLQHLDVRVVLVLVLGVVAGLLLLLGGGSPSLPPAGAADGLAGGSPSLPVHGGDRGNAAGEVAGAGESLLLLLPADVAGGSPSLLGVAADASFPHPPVTGEEHVAAGGEATAELFPLLHGGGVGGVGGGSPSQPPAGAAGAVADGSPSLPVAGGDGHRGVAGEVALQLLLLLLTHYVN